MEQFRDAPRKAGIEIRLQEVYGSVLVAEDAPCVPGPDSRAGGRCAAGTAAGSTTTPAGEILFQTDAGGNFGHWTDPRGRRTGRPHRPHRRLQALYDYQDYIAEEVPVIFSAQFPDPPVRGGKRPARVRAGQPLRDDPPRELVLRRGLGVTPLAPSAPTRCSCCCCRSPSCWGLPCCSAASPSGCGMPAVVGELAAGVLLGPTLLGNLAPAVSGWLLPQDAGPAAPARRHGQLGVLLLVAVTGMHIRPAPPSGGRARSGAGVSVGGLVVPLALGIGVAFLLPRDDARGAAPTARCSPCSSAWRCA